MAAYTDKTCLIALVFIWGKPYRQALFSLAVDMIDKTILDLQFLKKKYYFRRQYF